jgi:RHS repeat-associated protein
MAYDYMGRRFEYKETVSGTLTRHERYLYRGYLQIAALDMLNSANLKHTIAWDTSERIATRPLALQIGTGAYYYSFDQVKNVTELFDSAGAIAETYDYSPFGQLVASPGNVSNPLTFSSEIHDSALGLQYYNYRHLNLLDGRWVNRDSIEELGFFAYSLELVKNTESKNTKFPLNKTLVKKNYYQSITYRYPNGFNQIDLYGLEESACCKNKNNQSLVDVVLNAGSAAPKIGILIQMIVSAKGCLDAANDPCKTWGEVGGITGTTAYNACLACCGAIVIQTGIIVSPGFTCVALCEPLDTGFE